MAGAVRNRSSGGVSAVLFPRTDFPQQGWLPFVKAVAPNFPLYMVAADELANSFRSNDRRDGQRKRTIYTDFQQQQWFQAAVADRKSTRLNSSHSAKSRMPSSA